MNRLTATLVATTLAAATAAIHYARAWQQLRGSDAEPLHAMATTMPVPAAQSGTPADTGTMGPPLPSEEAAIRVVGVGRDPVSLAVARHRLVGLRDPQQRMQRAKEFVDLFLSGGWETMASQIGMSEEELMRHLEARTQRALQRTERLLECQLDTACDVDALRQLLNAASRREEEDLLGPELYSRFTAFQQASQDHQFVAQLNRRLPAGSVLSDAGASRLALALAGERQRFSAQAQQDGLRIMARISGGLLQLSAATDAGAADEYSRLRESASEYGSRLAGSAAAVLTPAQFALFKSELDAELAAFLSWLSMRETEARLRGQALPEGLP